MNIGWVDLIGVAAALCSITSFAPQIIKIVREKDASSVSLKTYALTVTTFVLWTAYGALAPAWPVAAVSRTPWSSTATRS